MRITPAKYARIRQAASAFILNGAGVVPNRDAGFEEPIYKIANDCFDFHTILATVDRELAKRGVSSDGSDPAGEAIIRAYDTALIVGYMFGVAVGLQLVGGINTTKGGAR